MATPASPTPAPSASGSALGASSPDSKAGPQTAPQPTSSPDSAPAVAIDRALLRTVSPEVLAQALAEQLAIAPQDWHRLSANRPARAREQAAAALVYMLKDQPQEAIDRLTQAIGWLDKTLKAPPCPTHNR